MDFFGLLEKELDPSGDGHHHVVDAGNGFVGVLQVGLGIAHAQIKLTAELGHIGLDCGSRVANLLDIQ
jgi:hypothetical protein